MQGLTIWGNKWTSSSQRQYFQGTLETRQKRWSHPVKVLCRILIFTTEIYIVPVWAFFPRRLWLSTNVTWSKSVSSSILSAMERSWSEVTLAPTIMVSTASNSWSSFHSVLCWTSAPLWICSRHHRDHTWRRQTWTFPFLIGAFWFRTLSGPFWPAGTGQAVSKSLENPPTCKMSAIHANKQAQAW